MQVWDLFHKTGLVLQESYHPIHSNPFVFSSKMMDSQMWVNDTTPNIFKVNGFVSAMNCLGEKTNKENFKNKTLKNKYRSSWYKNLRWLFFLVLQEGSSCLVYEIVLKLINIKGYLLEMILILTTIRQILRTTINKWDFIKLRSFCKLSGIGLNGSVQNRKIFSPIPTILSKFGYCNGNLHSCFYAYL